MNTKIFVTVFASVVLIQCNAELLNDVTGALNDQVSALGNDINKVLDLGNSVVGQATSSVNSIVSQGKDTIQNQIDNLTGILQTATQEAQDKLLDISNCTEIVDSALNALDLSILDQCLNSELLDEITAQLGDLGLVKDTLSVANCLLKNLLNLDGLKECVQSGVDKADAQIKSIENRLGTLVDDVTDAAANCVNTIVAKLDNDLTNVGNDLQTCLQGIL